MEAPVTQAVIAIAGSVAILAWPILVMMLRSVIEARRWRTWRAARAWMAAWFSGQGLWITAVWVFVIIGIRLITDAVLAGQTSVTVISWVLICMAMAMAVPFAWRAPRESAD